MTLPKISLDKKAFANFEEAIQKEWIITNGLGGYSSSTVLSINTRKYHGTLVAALAPPGNRRVCLAKLDEELIVESNVYPLGSNEFQNGIFPKGYIYLKEFRLSPFPKYVYGVSDVEVEKTVLMPYGKNVVITIYKVLNRANSNVGFRVYPLISFRHIHSVIDRWKGSFDFTIGQLERGFYFRFGADEHALLVRATDGVYNDNGKWLEKIYYREEAQRGESCLDDCYQPGYFEVSAEKCKEKTFALIAVADKNEMILQKLAKLPFTMRDVEKRFERETLRLKKIMEKFYARHEGLPKEGWLDWIVLATDKFIARGLNEEVAVIAGYHWFEAWGRDTFISLPGLTLVTGRFEDARKIFLTFMGHCKQGLIPNFLPDQLGQPAAYNSVDATLWFINAILQYLKYTNDFKFVRDKLWENLKAIIENYVEGTLFGIHVDNDYLLFHGPQLTWMDAIVDGQPITPRAGKAVEIQALWYNALKTIELLANKFGEKSKADEYMGFAEKARKSFTEKFWNSEKSYLFDVISEYGKDDSLRPNQIIAVALDFTMLDDAKNRKVVDVVQRELLTPYGVRTIARSSPQYMGVYSGDRRSRDKAYHNGTVWPWLLGPFVTAFLKTRGYSDSAREIALKNFLLPLFTEQIFKAGLGVVSEIFDGDPPHVARGCIAQAWSVAEPLRAYVEDVMLLRPKYEKEVLQSLG
ncbi:MAG: amylo-alpha-1,6-glucosidase [Candidatus Bathyarchaeia archaeon]